MFDESTFIGRLLDASQFFAIHMSSQRVHALPGEFGLSKDQTEDPIAVAREMMAREIGQDLPPAYHLKMLENYEELIIRWRGPKPMKKVLDGSFQIYPDICVESEDLSVVCLAEMAFGMNLDEIESRLDRLLNAYYFSLRHSSNLETIVAVVFIHELQSGEIIRDTEKRLNDWIGDNFGPFSKRTPMPMMPRLSRSSQREAVNPIYPALITGRRRGQYVSFCLSYSGGRP